MTLDLILSTPNLSLSLSLCLALFVSLFLNSIFLILPLNTTYYSYFTSLPHIHTHIHPPPSSLRRPPPVVTLLHAVHSPCPFFALFRPALHGAHCALLHCLLIASSLIHRSPIGPFACFEFAPIANRYKEEAPPRSSLRPLLSFIRSHDLQHQHPRPVHDQFTTTTTTAIMNLQSSLLGLTIFFVMANTLFVALRCYVRARLVRKFGLDDWLLIVAAILGIVLGALIATGVHHGLGRKDVANMSLAQIEQIMKYQTLCNVVYVADTAVVKLSVAILLLRISPKLVYIRILYVLIVGCIAWNLCVVCVTLFQCSPISAAWRQYVGGSTEHCLSERLILNIAIGFSSVDIFYSFVFALMPLPMLWNVQIPNNQKYGIWAILGLGLLYVLLVTGCNVC